MTAAPHLRLVQDDSTDGFEPPSDLDAEACVLSSVLVAPDALPKIIDFLGAEHFYSEANRRIFEAAVVLFRRKMPIDPQTVASWLKARGRLEQVGGIEYVAKLPTVAPSFDNVRAHALAVHDAWRRREVVYACQRTAAHGYRGAGDVQEWIDRSIRALGKIASMNPVRPVETNEQALERIIRESVESPIEQGGAPAAITGYPTGIYGLDRIVGGLCKGAKATIAATTGVGKTALAMQIAMSAAQRGLGVLFFSLEMKREEILRRALAHEGGVSGERMRFRQLTPRDKRELAAAAQRVKVLPWRIVDTPRITIEEIAATTRAMAEEMLLVEHVPLGMVVLDYVQRLEPAKHLQGSDEYRQVFHSTKSFKILCQELDVIGVELAQAKDPPPGSKPQKPRASNGIAKCSDIARESDTVLFLWPEDDPQNDPRQSVLAIVAKQRAGRKGEVPLMFRRDVYRFVDPNTPNAMASPSRQYVDTNPLTEGL